MLIVPYNWRHGQSSVLVFGVPPGHGAPLSIDSMRHFYELAEKDPAILRFRKALDHAFAVTGRAIRLVELGSDDVLELHGILYPEEDYGC